MPLQRVSSVDTRKNRDKDSIELRRSRGEISCAECRRLKLKCDKTIPCSSCVRRGCPTICPNKTLSTGQGTRFVLADSDTLHHKLSEMSKRIRQLEDALQIAHAAVSTGHHPFLSKELLEIKNGVVATSVPEKEVSPDHELTECEKELVDSLGQLTVDEGGEIYLGGAGALIVKHFKEYRSETGDTRNFAEMGKELRYLSNVFPFSPAFLPTDELQDLIESKLPSYARASSLVETYLENMSWFFRCVDRDQIMEELMPEVYRRQRAAANSSANLDEIPRTDPHVLALLLAIFACGAAGDLTLAPGNEESDLYYHLTKAALGLRSVFDGANLVSVQVISLIGMYDLWSSRRTTPEISWKMVNFSCLLAVSIGLHRDPARFKLSPKLVQRRRSVFWELYSADVWQSLASGRPSMFHRSVVDCQFPEDTEARLDENGEIIESPLLLKYRFTKEVGVDMLDLLVSTGPIKYSRIVELDQRVREFSPKDIIWSNDAEPHGATVLDMVKRHMISAHKDATLILLHRNFFFRALVENPSDPLQTAFAPSFISTFRSASDMLRMQHRHFHSYSNMMIRIWPIWGHVIMASIILATVAIVGPQSTFAPQAYGEFVTALSLLSKVTSQPITRVSMPVLLRLKEKAHNALYPKKKNEEPEDIPSPQSSLDLGVPIAPRPPTSESTSKSPSPLIPPEALFSTFAPSSDIVEFASLFKKSRAKNRDPNRMNNTQAMNIARPSAFPYIDHPQFIQNRPPEASQEGITELPVNLDVTSSVPPAQFSQTSHNFSDTHVVSPANVNAYSMDHQPMEIYENAWNSFVSSDAHQSPQSSLPLSAASLDARTSAYSSSLYGKQSHYSSDQGVVNLASLQHPIDFSGIYNGQISADASSLFNMDFDVSFDMRAAVGQEGSTPIMAQDLEAWDAILQDPRFCEQTHRNGTGVVTEVEFS